MGLLSSFLKYFIILIFLILNISCSNGALTEELLLKSGTYRDKRDYINQAETFEKMIEVIESDSYSDSINIMYSHGFTGMHFVYWRMGDLFFKLNRYGKSLLYFQKAKDTLLKSEFPSNVGIATSNSRIAKVYIELKQQEKAIKILKENIKLSSLSPIFQLDTYMLLKNIYINQKKFNKLRDIAIKLTSLKSNFLSQTAITCDIDIHLGEIYKYLKDFHQAKQFYQNCLTIASQQDNKYYPINRESYRLYALTGQNYLDLFTPNFMLGALYMDERKYHQANKYFNEAKKAIKVQGFIPKSNYAQILFYQSTIELKRKNYKLSLALLKQCIEVKKDINGENSLIQEYWAMSDLYEVLQNNQNSYKYMQKSYNLFLKNRYRNFSVLNSHEKQKYITESETLISNLFYISYKYYLSIKNKKHISSILLSNWLKYLNTKTFSLC